MTIIRRILPGLILASLFIHAGAKPSSAVIITKAWKHVTDSHGRVTAIYGAESDPLTGDSVEAKARAFLKEQASVLGLSADLSDLTLKSATHDAMGDHVRFQQTFRGYPVIGGGASAHLQNDRAYLADSSYRAIHLSQDSPSFTSDALSSLVFPKLKLSGMPVSFNSPVLSVWPKANETVWAWKYRVRDAKNEPYEILIDAETGTTYQVKRLSRSLQAPVYIESPKSTPVRVWRDLTHLDDSGYLESPYADVRLGASIGLRGITGAGKLKAGDDGFHFTPGDGKSNQVNAFYHINQVHDFFKGYGVDGVDYALPTLIQYKYPDGSIFENAEYDPSTGTKGILLVGQGEKGEDLSLDADVVQHEYSHFAMSQINYDYSDYNALETAGMNEGFADYFAATISGNPNLGEFISEIVQGTGSLRDLSNRRHYPEDTGDGTAQGASVQYVGYTESHVLGELISGAVWDIRNVIGSDDSAKLLINALSLLNSTSSFPDLRAAMVTTDLKLFDGKYADTIKAAFDERGIGTQAASYLSPDAFTSLRQKAQVLIGPILNDSASDTEYFDPEYIGATFVAGRAYQFSGYVFDKKATKVTLKFSSSKGGALDDLTQTQDISLNNITNDYNIEQGLSFTFPLVFPDSLAGQTVTLALTFQETGGATWSSSAKISVVKYAGPSVPLVAEPARATEALLGDADGDQSITIKDATRAMRFIVGLETSSDLLLALDVTPSHADGAIGDDKITTADAVLILKKAIGIASY